MQLQIHRGIIDDSLAIHSFNGRHGLIHCEWFNLILIQWVPHSWRRRKAQRFDNSQKPDSSHAKRVLDCAETVK
jgi:hypothetical protein